VVEDDLAIEVVEVRAEFDTPLPKHLHRVTERFDQHVSVLGEGIGSVRSAHSGRESEAAHEGLGAVVTRSHADAELVEHLGDVVG